MFMQKEHFLGFMVSGFPTCLCVYSLFLTVVLLRLQLVSLDLACCSCTRSTLSTHQPLYLRTIKVKHWLLRMRGFVSWGEVNVEMYGYGCSLNKCGCDHWMMRMWCCFKKYFWINQVLVGALYSEYCYLMFNFVFRSMSCLGSCILLVC